MRVRLQLEDERGQRGGAIGYVEISGFFLDGSNPAFPVLKTREIEDALRAYSEQRDEENLRRENIEVMRRLAAALEVKGKP